MYLAHNILSLTVVYRLLSRLYCRSRPGNDQIQITTSNKFKCTKVPSVFQPHFGESWKSTARMVDLLWAFKALNVDSRRAVASPSGQLTCFCSWCRLACHCTFVQKVSSGGGRENMQQNKGVLATQLLTIKNMQNEESEMTTTSSRG